jgi:flagellar biosynthesis chaperone FliJ
LIVQDLKYLLKENEVQRVWHDQHNLIDFYNSGTAALNIKSIVNDYFDQLPLKFYKMKKEVEELSISVDRAFHELLQMMKKYNESMIIDGEFVR